MLTELIAFIPNNIVCVCVCVLACTCAPNFLHSTGDGKWRHTEEPFLGLASSNLKTLAR